MITSSDIQLLLSGGSSNKSADRSLGGEPSSFTVQQTVQRRLFDDISNENAKAGYTDHRCLCLHNRSDLFKFYDTTLSIPSVVEGGADIGIGCLFQTDTQRLVVRGSVGYGYIKLRYTGIFDQTVTAEYSSDAATWALNIQNALNSISGIETKVIALTAANTITFTISFTGISDNRYHLPLIVESDTSLEGNPVISIEKTRDGSPFNSTASTLESKTSIPPNVVFNEDGLYLGTMLPGDTVPIWIKRIINPGTEAVEDDGFSLDISGSAYPS